MSEPAGAYPSELSDSQDVAEGAKRVDERRRFFGSAADTVTEMPRPTRTVGADGTAGY